MRPTRFRLLITAGLLAVVALVVTIVVVVTRPTDTGTGETRAARTETAETAPSRASATDPASSAASSSSSPADARSSFTASPTPASTSASPSVDPDDFPTARPDTGRPSPSGTDPDLSPEGLSDTELVTLAATTMTTWDTASDVSRTNGYRRVLPLFTEEWDEVFTVPMRPTVSASWREAAQHEAVSEPAVEIINRADTADGAHYAVEVSITWTADDGWSLEDPDPVRMTFHVVEYGDDYIIQNWSEGMIQ